MVRVNASFNHKSRFCVILVFTGFAALLPSVMPVHAQQGLLNRTLVPADSSQNGLISDIVDDRAIKQLISSKAELLLPDPEVSLLDGFEDLCFNLEISRLFHCFFTIIHHEASKPRLFQCFLAIACIH